MTDDHTDRNSRSEAAHSLTPPVDPDSHARSGVQTLYSLDDRANVTFSVGQFALHKENQRVGAKAQHKRSESACSPPLI